MKKPKSLALCASTAFYKTAITISRQLKKMGIEPLLPRGAMRMARTKTFDADNHKIAFEKNRDYKQKAELMLDHFAKIHAAEGVLVINETKNGHDGYIGGNVLMEMAIAFHEKKPIFILNPVSETLSHFSEIMGMMPIILDGNVENIVREKILVAVGSKNPVKINAVRQAFEKVWPDKKWQVVGADVSSGVNNQPLSDKETVRGAKTRAQKALKLNGADFGVGLEGGLQPSFGSWFESVWVVVTNKKGESGIGSTQRMSVPGKMMKHIQKGKELGEVDDIFFKSKNSKQVNGHFGLMTKDALTRTDACRDAVIAALTRFIHPKFF